MNQFIITKKMVDKIIGKKRMISVSEQEEILMEIGNLVLEELGYGYKEHFINCTEPENL